MSYVKNPTQQNIRHFCVTAGTTSNIWYFVICTSRDTPTLHKHPWSSEERLFGILRYSTGTSRPQSGGNSTLYPYYTHQGSENPLTYPASSHPCTRGDRLWGGIL
ncbi:hypothetical protein AVEN_202445-1 [Araneus ventricosus]|uniref:Uncharacterized protein n=1 Tax=Araneus ventricosus TaxID=182803 RepID=A0A4Y2D276_ARAVE|nr:hypothetical protein AVEN_257788-1 [Araneus ventricosus]GBM10238.1 hypothetical protein AVEN_35911-1 [Araneus ventricosus]GBM10304.1 hypothetical protein AVEN_86087-1 [Araneus ventricosus]GBM10390.1 hypothetical protein AVEN_202445-1 [Araneus ventricosus]